MEGAAPETPVVEEPPVRFSRRVKGENPSVLDEVLNTAAVKKLKLGGKGGRGDGDKTAWQLHSALPGQAKIPEQSTYEETKEVEEGGRLRIVDLDRLTEALNTTDCNCIADSDLNSFAEFCVANDPNMTKNRMKKLLEQWKQGREFHTNEKNKVKIEENSLGFATSIKIGCSNCSEAKEVRASKSKKFTGTCYSGKLSEQENCTWYEANLKLVLATIASGIGPSDMETFLSFLDLPISQSFPSQTFHKIENLIGKSIVKIGKQSMEEGLLEEILAETGLTKEEWMQLNTLTGLKASYDMGWSKRSSGNRFDSLSAHAFLIGCKCRKIIAAQIASKKCRICQKAIKKGEPADFHDCPLNHEGSSKAMEADGLLEILKRLHKEYEGKVYMESIVSDDDTTMKAIIRHQSSIANKGRLPTEIPEPTWLALTLATE